MHLADEIERDQLDSGHDARSVSHIPARALRVARLCLRVMIDAIRGSGDGNDERTEYQA
jgi:hypothetical protein